MFSDCQVKNTLEGATSKLREPSLESVALGKQCMVIPQTRVIAEVQGFEIQFQGRVNKARWKFD